MTDYVWVGTTSTSASTNTNWIPLGVPAVGDTVTFNATSTQKCEWDIALPATAFSVDEVILDDDFSYSLELDVTIRTKALYVGGGTLAAGADGNMKFEHGSSPNEFGSQKSFDERFIMIGDGGTIEQNVVFTIGGTVSVNTYFDDGSYPTVILIAGTFSPQYKTPTGTSGKVSFYDWQIPSASSPTFAPTGDLTDNDRLKVFAPTTFTWSINTMNFGLATVEFLGTSGGIQLPIKGASGYGTDFLGIYRKVVIKANTAGHRVIMSDNTFLSVEEFEVQDGALFKGAVDDTSQGCEIHCISKPKINGTWSFSQITEGIYRSPRHSQGAMGYVGGDFRITGKLTVDGLIDPTGMVFEPQAVNPELTNPDNTIWIDSETNHLFRGVRDTESTVHFNVRNDEGATIPLGAPLYSKGEIGGSKRIKVGIADASDPNKMPAIGLAMEEMNTTSTKDGNMILTGILNDNITITGVVEQDIIYVAPHGGTAPYLTITRPTSPSHLVQNVGVCVRQSATNVSQGMKVAAIGRTNDSPNCSFLMVNTESTHPQARRLVAGTNITLTDGGAGGDLTIAASGGGGGSGTVTSVGFSVPTGFTISGSPITTSGTLGLAFDTGYALPTSAKQTQWDTAYGWGDHATAGYLTSFTEADPIFSVSQAALITNAGGGDVSKGETAFGWGDHSVAGYAPATPEVCVVNLATSVSNFTPTGAYTLLQRTGNWASTNPNFNTATGLYTVATDGIYRISWSNSFRFTPVGQLQASRIYVNGNPAAQGTTSSSGAWPIGSASVLLTLSTGDTVGLYVYISTTGTTLVGDNLVPFSNHMSINKVSN